MRKNFWIKFRSWVLWSFLVLIWHVQGGGRGSINRRRHCRCLRSTPRVKFHWSVNPRRDTPWWYGHRIVPHLLIPIFGPIQQIPTAMFSKISFIQYWVLFSIYHKNEKKGLLVVIYLENNLFYTNTLVLTSKWVALPVESITWSKYFLSLYNSSRSILRRQSSIFRFLASADFEAPRERILSPESLTIVCALVILVGSLRDHGIVWRNSWRVHHGGVCSWLSFSPLRRTIVKKGSGEFCCKMWNIFYSILESKIPTCLLITTEINNLRILQGEPVFCFPQGQTHPHLQYQ